MALGAGKYDELCTEVREKTEALGVLLIIIGGNQGPGFSCQASLEITQKLPDILRSVADKIQADTREFGMNPN